MCAFHYWLALITKPFQAVGNNGFRRQLNCPARFARDSLIGMQHFTCAFSPTIGCHAPLPNSQKPSPSRVDKRFDFVLWMWNWQRNLGKEILEMKRVQWSWKRRSSCRISLRDLRNEEWSERFRQIFCQASLSNDRSYKGAGSDATRI